MLVPNFGMEQNMSRKSRHRGRNSLLGIITSIILAVGAFYASGELRNDKEDPTVVLNTQGNMQVHYIDVGQGNSTLIMCDGKAMLIDAGDNSEGTAVQSYLAHNNVSSLEYVIGTHPDADHIGGLDVIITKFDCKTIIMPDVSADTATYRDVIDAIKYKNNKITTPVAGNTYKLGSAVITIIGPLDKYSDTNNNSVSVIVQHGSKRFLFTGDAEEEAETDMLKSGVNLKCDVYEAGHHGSKTASTENFMKAVSPEYVVISCGSGNERTTKMIQA